MWGCGLDCGGSGMYLEQYGVRTGWVWFRVGTEGSLSVPYSHGVSNTAQ